MDLSLSDGPRATAVLILGFVFAGFRAGLGAPGSLYAYIHHLRTLSDGDFGPVARIAARVIVFPGVIDEHVAQRAVWAVPTVPTHNPRESLLFEAL
ncbi:hypothetical protein BU26DRAFT_513403 [Trematosphaeria pertusa]|uniref:Uncharacterized protein n=1 Tax=Trematosphaeria pertusa TaxID=390896 RepID=A0A6A6J1Q3_9PLEO|nr:uncharacterized protein BU26DRAFT_513403 [Trematosphaeria pertusa]KAF2256596.1 hypothetical protein BU26DRAFT_513403 [Trematosphaeria pertusa]